MFKYALAAIVCLIFSAVTGVFAVGALKRLNAKQTVSGYVTEHRQKNGTPTMGGVIFALPSLIVFFIFASGERQISLVAAAVFFAYAVIGFFDDFIKVRFRKNEGLTPLQKIIFQFIVAVAASAFTCRMGLYEHFIPFTTVKVDLGLWFLPLGTVVFLSSSNCVNLTDGLDALAATTSTVCLIFSAALILLEKKFLPADAAILAEYDNLALLCVSVAASLGGFLLFNTGKASVFMGDTGSLALGGLFSAVLMLSSNVFYIPVLGITFVMSGLSVIIQVAHFKRTGRRVFLMAPLHHHFQQKGLSEGKITYIYKFVTVIFSLAALLAYL